MSNRLSVHIDKLPTMGFYGGVTIKLGKGLEVHVGTDVDRKTRYRDANQLKAALREAGWNAGHALLTAFADNGRACKALRPRRTARRTARP